MKATPQHKPQMRFNPVELTIILVMALVCANSIYKLFFDWSASETIAQVPSGQNDANSGSQSTSPSGSQSGARTPASVAIASVEITCESTKPQAVHAQKVRISGPLCTLPATSAKSDFVKTEVKNLTNNSSATVFADLTANRFLTDFVPLSSGENMISIKFLYKEGRSTSQTVTLSRQ